MVMGGGFGAGIIVAGVSVGSDPTITLRHCSNI